MLFNSLHFLIFFPVVVFLYFSIPQRFRWILLLISSYYFYMSWNAKYIILIIISTLIDYFSAIRIYNSKTLTMKRMFLFFSIFSNIGLLFFFKYFNFFSESLNELFKYFAIPLHPITVKVLLPVGISFYTFQTLSYTIDVYRGVIKPQRHLGIFAVYVSFFPQLVAGPIERAKNLLPQFFETHNFDYFRISNGLKLMLWGFFKKVVVADNIALFVDKVYGNVYDQSGLSLFLATILFAFQIFADFSGYSDIAIGAAQVLGFKLMDNFKRPYFASSLRDFWKRWHISLTTWFKDYVYIPLGGSRVSTKRWFFNIMVVFLLSGLWHGANWTFVFWGFIHGLYMLFEIVIKPFKEAFYVFSGLIKFPKIIFFIEWLATFFIVNISWVFFRSKDVSESFYVLSHMFSDWSLSSINFFTTGTSLLGVLLLFVFIAIMEFVHLIEEHKNMRYFMNDKPRYFRWAVYIIIFFLIILFGAFNNTQFIYFQF